MRPCPSAWILACALIAQAQGPGELERAIALEQSGKTDQAIGCCGAC